MLLASYKGQSKGLAGYLDIFIKYRLSGPYSHNEIVFEESDNVDRFMPDKTTMVFNGEHWCASSSGIDSIPLYSPRRPGKLGGVRFKRIDINDGNWDIIKLDKDPQKAAQFFFDKQGIPYDYRLVLKYVSWSFTEYGESYICSEAIAQALGYRQSYKLDPCLLHYVELNNN